MPILHNWQASLARDLSRPSLMILKAALFIAAAALCGLILAMWITPAPTLAPSAPVAPASPWTARASTLLVYAVGAWCLCRAYFFAFHVITGWCDPGFRYAGIWSAIRWVLSRRTNREPDSR